MKASRARGVSGSLEPIIRGYRDFKRVAVGGFSTVYTAYQESFARTVAVKIINADLGDDDAVRRFARECRALGRLSDLPEVVSVFEGGATSDGRPFIAMQYFPRGALSDLVMATGPLSVPEAVGVGLTLARALTAAHESGIIHRDVKPGNLLVSDDGHAVLSDFGTAAVVSDANMSISLASYTPVHCAPEVLDGGEYGSAADTYAFGSTLYTLLAGAAPFAMREGDGPATVLRRILLGDAPELSDEVPPALRDLIMRMIAVDSRVRPDVTDVAAELTALADSAGASPLRPSPPRPLDHQVPEKDPLDGIPLVARPVSPVEVTDPENQLSTPTVLRPGASSGKHAQWPARRPGRARPATIIAAIVALLLLAGGGSWYALTSRTSAPARVIARPSPSAPRLVGAVTPTPSPSLPSSSPSPTPAAPLPAVPPPTTVPAPTHPPAATMPPNLSTAEAVLYGRLNGASLNKATCVGRPDLEKSMMANAVLACNAASDGVQVVVTQFPSAYMGAIYNSYFAGHGNFVQGVGTCAAGQAQSTQWDHDDREVGPLVCVQIPGDPYRIFWGFDSSFIMAYRGGTDHIALYQWWMNYANLLTQ